MFSADEKRQLEQLRVQRIVRWAVGISLLLHGVLWAVSPLIKAPPSDKEAIFEVTLSSAAIKVVTVAPRRLAVPPHPTPQPKIPTPQPKRLTRQTVKQSTKKPEKATKTPRRVAALPHIKPQQHSIPGVQATPLPSGVPTFIPLRSFGNPRVPTSNDSGAPTKKISPSRAFGGNVPVSSNPARESEIATWPTVGGQATAGQMRSGRKRGQDTQVYLPDNGDSSGASSSNLNNSPRPSGLQSDSGRPFASNVAPDSGRIARQPMKGDSQPSFGPDSPRPTARPNPRREEAGNNSASENNSPRQTRIARRPKGDDPDLFPTPTPKPEPKEIPKPQPEPERELFRPAKVRSAPKPAYPADAKAKNQEGVVVVRLQISEEGRVTDASIVSSSGISSLDEASLRGVRRWTYEPARRGQTTVATSLNARLRWRLTD